MFWRSVVNHRIMQIEGDCPEAVSANRQLEPVAQGHVQLIFEYCQGWKFHSHSVQAGPIFD